MDLGNPEEHWIATGPGLDEEARASVAWIFREARSFSTWLDRPVEPALLREAWELASHVPAGAGALRLVLVGSHAGKAKLRHALAPGHVERVMRAPVTAVFGWTHARHRHATKHVRHKDETGIFERDRLLLEETAFRSATLQAAAFMLAARAVGLDYGPLGGFDREAVRQAFFPEGDVEVSFLCNFGYGDRSKLVPEPPRPSFEEAARFG